MTDCPDLQSANGAARAGNGPPRVAIVIPTLDEAAHIGAVLASLRAGGVTAPILVVDGQSRDATRTIVRARMRQDRALYLVDNPGRVQAAGVNRAAAAARDMGAEVMVRLDAHARYPSGFVHGIVETLRRTGADSVVVPLVAEGDRGWQAAAAALQRSWLGHGGAAHRRTGRRGWVSHGHHAAFRLDRFLALGGYDPRFVACEDVEFDHRLIASGGRIWLEDRWPVSYRPRPTPSALWAQMFRNGRWRVAAARASRRALGLRQLAPVAAATGACLSLAASAIVPFCALPALAYGALVLALAGRASSADLAPRVAWLALVSHFGFALGVLDGMLRPPPATGLRQRLRDLQARLGPLPPALAGGFR